SPNCSRRSHAGRDSAKHRFRATMPAKGRTVMKTLLPLAALLASPALAQDAQVYHASATWPVHASDGACTLVQAQPESGSALSVGYDGDEVILTSTAEVESPLPPSGRVPLEIVFLENGNTDY